MDSISPLVQALLIVNPLLSILVGASLWFGLGGRLGKLEATMNGYKEMMAQLRKDREDCQEREQKRIEDHEQRLRELREIAHEDKS